MVQWQWLHTFSSWTNGPPNTTDIFDFSNSTSKHLQTICVVLGRCSFRVSLNSACLDQASSPSCGAGALTVIGSISDLLGSPLCSRMQLASAIACELCLWCCQRLAATECCSKRTMCERGVHSKQEATTRKPSRFQSARHKQRSTVNESDYTPFSQHSLHPLRCFRHVGVRVSHTQPRWQRSRSSVAALLACRFFWRHLDRKHFTSSSSLLG